MEQIKTTSTTAYQILAAGNRKIVIETGEKVNWINPNNHTAEIKTGKSSARMIDLENRTLFICVPANAKTVF